MKEVNEAELEKVNGGIYRKRIDMQFHTEINNNGINNIAKKD